jgi:thermitase
VAKPPVQKVVVAVIDTGVDAGHPYLYQQIEKNKDLPHVYGWDVSSDSFEPDDEHGHGTHIAGIIAAIGRNSTTGKNPISIMSIKYCCAPDTGMGNSGKLAQSIEYAVSHGAKIINISSGGSGFIDTELAAISSAERAGVLVIVAAGNDARKLGMVYPDGYDYYPAQYRVKSLLVVGATRKDGGPVPSSNWGLVVDVSAPGERIFSSLPNGRYGEMTGTSQATAFASGVAALLLAQDPSLTPLELKNIIVKSARREVKLWGMNRSQGTVDAAAALRLVRSFKRTPVRRPILRVSN